MRIRKYITNKYEVDLLLKEQNLLQSVVIYKFGNIPKNPRFCLYILRLLQNLLNKDINKMLDMNIIKI